MGYEALTGSFGDRERWWDEDMGYATVIDCPISWGCEATQCGECDGLLTMAGARIVVGKNGCKRPRSLYAYYFGRDVAW